MPVSSASGMNSPGGEQAARRVRPAHERLDADDRAALEVDDGLVVHDELSSQRALRSSATSSRRPTRSSAIVGAYMTYCALPDRLRPVHRDVGGAQEVVRDRAQRDPDARADEHLAPLDRRKGFWSVATMRSAASTADAGARDLLDEDGELVAAEPRDRVAGRERVAEAQHRRRAAARRPAAWPSVSLTPLKSSRSRKRTATSARVQLAPKDERVLDAVREERAVREPGQRVVERLVAELLLGLATRRDVEQVALEDGLVAVADDARLVLHPDGSDRRACGAGTR